MRPNQSGETPTNVTPDKLVALARQAQARAYAPYSGFHVGSAVLTDDGRVFTGANVENASYGATACAESNAVRAMAHSEQLGEVTDVVVTADGDEPVTPCGICRQVIFEFGPNARIHSAGRDGKVVTWPITDLLPRAFGPKRLAAGEPTGPADKSAELFS